MGMAGTTPTLGDASRPPPLNAEWRWRVRDTSSFLARKTPPAGTVFSLVGHGGRKEVSSNGTPTMIFEDIDRIQRQLYTICEDVYDKQQKLVEQNIKGLRITNLLQQHLPAQAFQEVKEFVASKTSVSSQELTRILHQLDAVNTCLWEKRREAWLRELEAKTPAILNLLRQRLPWEVFREVIEVVSSRVGTRISTTCCLKVCTQTQSHFDC
jgi:hypothetical protein